MQFNRELERCNERKFGNATQGYDSLKILLNNCSTTLEAELMHCKQCNAYFPSLPYLMRHQAWHVEMSSRMSRMACSNCSQTFEDKRNLQTHRSAVHSQQASHVCSNCAGVFDTRLQLKQHLMRCTKPYDWSDNKQTDWLKLTGSDFDCGQLVKKLISDSDTSDDSLSLLRHSSKKQKLVTSSIHRDVMLGDGDVVDSDNRDSKAESGLSSGGFEVDKIDFAALSLVDSHMFLPFGESPLKSVWLYDDLLCTVVSDSCCEKKENKNQEEVVNCEDDADDNDKENRTPILFRLRVNTIKNRRALQSKENLKGSCYSSASRSKSKRGHRKKKGNHNLSRRCCIDCSQICYGALALKEHSIKAHQQPKPYKCQQCEKRFTCRSNLNTHLTLHAGIMLHQCQQCERRFRLRSNLRKHLEVCSLSVQKLFGGCA